MGWASAELGQRLKGDREKVRMARRLRAETTVSLKWIAACLVMGTWTYVANRLYHCNLSPVQILRLPPTSATMPRHRSRIG